MQRQVSFNTYSKQYLEMSHNLVHNIAGGGMNGDDDRYWGHMDPIEYSAFDPIFWLHHTFVSPSFFPNPPSLLLLTISLTDTASSTATSTASSQSTNP